MIKLNPKSSSTKGFIIYLRLKIAGASIGYKISEYLCMTSIKGQRPAKLIDALYIITGLLWPQMEGAPVESVERSTSQIDECKRFLFSHGDRK